VLEHQRFMDLVPQMANDTHYGTKIRMVCCTYRSVNSEWEFFGWPRLRHWRRAIGGGIRLEIVSGIFTSSGLRSSVK
jgi:hypothetical protein